MGSAPEPGPDTADPANSPARLLAEEQLADPGATWTMGADGASARFSRRPEERVSRGPGSAVTARGGIRLVLPDEVTVIAYETPSATDPLRWDHAVAFCITEDQARQRGHTVVTEVGPDSGALRPQDTGAILFDLGMGGPFADLLVRTADPSPLAALRAAVAAPDDPATDLTTVLADPAVHRVVRTAGGRIEMTAPPPAVTPGGRTHPATAPVPDGWVPCAVVRPAHPAMDRTGRPVPFDRDRHDAFQALLAAHGDPVLGVLKAEVAAAVRAGRGPEGALVANDAAGRSTVAVAVRQLALTEGTSGALAAWRSRYG